MLIALLIMLREGIEAALIVGIVASFLKQSGHSELMPKVWLGVFLASVMCLGIGYGIHSVTGEIPQKEQELVVGVIGLVAVAMLTYMILWMKKAARSMKQHLQDSVQSALNRGSGQGWALVGIAFLIVVAAGLLAGSFRALHEAGVWNVMQDIAFDTSKYLHEDSPLGVLLGGFFGYTDHPTEGEVLIWLLYLVPVMIWFLRGSAPAKTLTK